MNKRQEILKVAQELVRTNGYNGFSFREISEKVGIKSASVHYHFATKVLKSRIGFLLSLCHVDHSILRHAGNV